NKESRVASLAARYRMVDFICFDLPTGKDGFLATNSLLAFGVLLSRAYLDVSGQAATLPKDFRSLLMDRRLGSNGRTANDRYAKLLSRKTLIVLHGPATRSEERRVGK